MIEQREEFFRELDSMILSGAPVMQIVRALNIRERTIRRRKAELAEQGHTLTKLRGNMPGVTHVGTT